MKRVLAVLLFPLLSAAAEATPASVLVYEMAEPGVDGYPARYLVTADYLRLDDGQDAGNYVLYDRRTRIIYNVVHADRTIGEIHWRAVEQPMPQGLRIKEEAVTLGGEAPNVGGRTPFRRQLYVGERLCLDAVVVPELMPDARAAMAAMQDVMAGEHAAMIPHIPADMQDHCDLAVNVYKPGWAARLGLPVEQREFNGRRWSLVDFRAEVETATGLFTLPVDYRRFNISEMK
ncbi:MAG: hypothetical protein M0R77_04360 [Gammaproteobacteria bacterium]|nr:hypothetical protein [Gammaproteobacteria bacterium]